MTVANASHSASMTHIHACKKFPATVATVKCPSDRNNFNSYNCLIFNGQISLYNVTLKLKKLFSARKAIFRNPFLLCCVSFYLLGKILLVSCIQTAGHGTYKGDPNCASMDCVDLVLVLGSGFGVDFIL